ncbi:MAG: hypothetical protein LC795_17830 [Acidobacteria bacterium]|nr:hypothetical protein [Acidobacteriota bacterium]
MKEGFDREIDSLLRRRARATAAKSFADGDGAASAASAHLDADELGAFAEGALPAGARLAAASHLADCDRCRGAAVSLARALGGAEVKQHAATVPASTETPRPASWRAWAAALFSPRALRYSAPVLALSLVAVVSFVALRSRDAGSSPDTQSARPQAGVAETRPAAPAAETAGTANDNQSGMLDRKPEDGANDLAASGTTTAPPSAGRGPHAGEPQPAPVGSVAEDTAAPPPPAASQPTTSASPEAPAEIAKSAPKAVAVETSPPAKSDGADNNKEKSARGAEPVDEVAANEAAAQRRAASRAGEGQMPDGGTRNQKRGADTNTSNVYDRGNATAGATQRESERDDRRAGGALAAPRRGRPNARAEQRTEEGAALSAGETRAAAGHRFRREGSAWVDVNYRPSMRSTGVRRGTEAFRALVADVPVVGRVAEQLPGEVVVVVGGRAYRIR